MKSSTSRRCSLLSAFVLLLCPLGCSTAQKSSSRVVNPADVDTIEHIIRADYECVSGPSGPVEKVRQKKRDDAFYIPGALFVSTFEKDGQMKSQILTQDTYWAGHGPVVHAAYETEAGHRIERFGNVAQVRSVSVVRDTPDGPITERYVNYSQLYWDGTRWWITGEIWQEESPNSPIPDSWVGTWEETTH